MAHTANNFRTICRISHKLCNLSTIYPVAILKFNATLLPMSRLRYSLLPMLCMLLSNSLSAKIIHDWTLDKQHIKDNKLEEIGVLQKPAKFDSEGLLIFSDGQQIHFPEETAKAFSSKPFSIVAKVRVDKPQAWGGFVGFTQDNGNYEKGWILGYNNSNYTFKAAKGSLKIISSKKSISAGQWATLIAIYDGDKISLYVDGKLAQSQQIGNKIDLADIPTNLVIGAYRDKDENFPLEGRIQNIKIYNNVLDQEFIKKKADDSIYKFAVRPKVAFTAPGEAKLTWESTHSGTSSIAYGLTKKFTTITPATSTDNFHSINLKNLETGKTYFYRLSGTVDGKRKLSPIYEFNTSVNYASSSIPKELKLAGSKSDYSKLASKLVGLNKQKAGICLVVGIKDGSLALEIAKQSKFKVICIEKDQKLIDSVRVNLYQTGFYGSRISIFKVYSYKKLPITTGIANLITSEQTKLPISLKAGYALLAPNSKLVILDGETFTVKSKKNNNTTDWNHQYGTAANTSNAGESLKGATATNDLQVQWIGRPGGDFGIDRQPRMPAPLASNGRLYHQGHNRMICLDSHNGQILWSYEIPDLRRINIPRDCSNWCADKDHLYIAIKDRAWKLNAATGEQTETFKLTDSARGEYDWGYIANSGDYLIGSSVLAGSHLTEFWGSQNWFDGATDRRAIAQVISYNLFAYNKHNSASKWAYGKGLIINSTITIEGENIYFLENRSPDLKNGENGRISDNSLWTDKLYAVCLDLKSGKVKWEKPFPKLEYVTATQAGVPAGYGLATKDSFYAVISQSIAGKNTGYYTYYSFSAKSGKLEWDTKTQWRASHHGAHIQHPVIIQDHLYTDPSGIDLKKGKPLGYNYGPRAACAAAVGSGDTLFYRGLGGAISVWGIDEKEVTFWKRLRPSCWLSYIPSNGMLLIPDGGAGCSCGGWMETSLGFAPVRSK